jgi:uncharacterized protein (DUF983 family)
MANEPRVGFRDAYGEIHGLESLGICPKCGGHFLYGVYTNHVLTGVQCGDCGELVAVIKDAKANNG